MILKGEKKVEEKLYLRLYKKESEIIFLYLLKHGCNRQEAEDIVQETFVKLLEYKYEIEKGKERSWLFTVALNDFRNRYKRKLKADLLKLEIEKSAWEEVVDEPAIILLKKEKIVEIIECLNELKESQKELLLLKYEMDCSYKDIAQLLGMSEDKVKIYLYRSRNAFKEVWRKKNERR